MTVSILNCENLSVYEKADSWLCRHKWSSEELLKTLLPNSLALLTIDPTAVREEMWRNLVAEFDAVHLSKAIHARHKLLSKEFLTFEAAWLQDEINHYKGLRRIFSVIFEEDEKALDTRVKERMPDFSRIENFIIDEFVLCVCFAYDELASTKGYADAFPLYDSFNNISVSKWIRLTARDEIFHCFNAQYLIRKVHHRRIEEVPAVLRTIVENENPDPTAYRATFLFDHGTVPGSNPFTENFLQSCANEICRYLNVQPAFA